MLNKKQVLLLLVFMAPCQLMASNVNFLRYSVITDFTESDIELLKIEYAKVLNKDKPGETHSWLNEETKNGGEIKVIKQYREKDQPCKRLMFKSKSKHQAAASYFNFCLIDKQWQVVN